MAQCCSMGTGLPHEAGGVGHPGDLRVVEHEARRFEHVTGDEAVHQRRDVRLGPQGGTAGPQVDPARSDRRRRRRGTPAAGARRGPACPHDALREVEVGVLDRLVAGDDAATGLGVPGEPFERGPIDAGIGDQGRRGRRGGCRCPSRARGPPRGEREHTGEPGPSQNPGREEPAPHRLARDPDRGPTGALDRASALRSNASRSTTANGAPGAASPRRGRLEMQRQRLMMRIFHADS